MNKTDKHIFALYYADLSDCSTTQKKNITLSDPVVVHRMMRVLRLQVADDIVLFDRTVHANCVIESMHEKKGVVVRILRCEPNSASEPEVHVLLPLLKRDDLEAACSMLVCVGATTIQLVSTEKTHQQTLTPKEFARLHTLMVAAAEQCKNYAFPELLPPCELKQALKDLQTFDGVKLFGDPSGQSLWQVAEKMRSQSSQSTVCFVGPEGDLIESEKKMLQDYSFVFVALTPTILRAYHAIELMVGCLRSLVR